MRRVAWSSRFGLDPSLVVVVHSSSSSNSKASLLIALPRPGLPRWTETLIGALQLLLLSQSLLSSSFIFVSSAFLNSLFVSL